MHMNVKYEMQLFKGASGRQRCSHLLSVPPTKQTQHISTMHKYICARLTQARPTTLLTFV